MLSGLCYLDSLRGKWLIYAWRVTNKAQKIVAGKITLSLSFLWKHIPYLHNG